jgi:putative transposase
MGLRWAQHAHGTSTLSTHRTLPLPYLQLRVAGAPCLASETWVYDGPNMPTGLVRYQHTGHFHFLTFSCHRRQPFFRSAKGRSLFERSLETMRIRYDFVVSGYVVMPEHVHLLVSEPRATVLSTAIQALKLSVSVQSRQRPFWQARYYDFNVYTPRKRSEKIEYMHQNPVKRGLVSEPSEWLWSSYRHYQTGECGTVEVESDWTAAKRVRDGV